MTPPTPSTSPPQPTPPSQPNPPPPPPTPRPPHSSVLPHPSFHSHLLPHSSSISLLPRHALAGLTAVTAHSLLSHPLNTIVAATQSLARPGVSVPFQEAAAHIATKVGQSQALPLSALFSGFVTHTCGRVPSLAVRYGGYELSKAFQLDGLTRSKLHPSEALLAGAAAGAAESLISTPFALLTTRLQLKTPIVPPVPPSSPLTFTGPPPLMYPAVTSATGVLAARSLRPVEMVGSTQGKATAISTGWRAAGMISPVDAVFAPQPAQQVPRTFSLSLSQYPWLPVTRSPAPGVWQLLYHTVSLEGSPQLWRGFRATAGRDIAFSATFFYTWATLEQLAQEIRSSQPRPAGDVSSKPLPSGPLPADPSVMEQCVEAGLAAAVAAFVSHPLDSARTRTQAAILPKHISRELSMLRIREDTRLFDMFLGLRWWDKGRHWHGVSLRCINASVSTMVLIASYKGMVNLLRDFEV